MLLKTISELTTATGFVSKDLYINAMYPDILFAENKLVKYLSAAQMADLQTKYDNVVSAPLNDLTADLLAKCQAFIGYMALCNFASKKNVSFENTGLQSLKTGNSVPVREWMLNDHKAQLIADAWECMDLLLQFLETNKATFTLWASSAEYTINKKFIINSLEQFEEHFSLNGSRLTLLALYPSMQFTEQQHIEAAIGKEYFEELKAKIAGDTFGSAVLCTASTIASDTQTKVAHGLLDGDRLMPTSLGTVTGTGLAINTIYFVVEKTTDTFKLSLTSGGAAINLTGADTTPITYKKVTANVLTADDTIIVENYLRPALAYLTVAAACQTLPLQVKGTGIFYTEQNVSLETSRVERTAMLQQLEYLRQTCLNRGGQYLNRCVIYLNAEAADDKYITYFESDTYTDPADTTPVGINNDDPDSAWYKMM